MGTAGAERVQGSSSSSCLAEAEPLVERGGRARITGAGPVPVPVSLLGVSTRRPFVVLAGPQSDGPAADGPGSPAGRGEKLGAEGRRLRGSDGAGLGLDLDLALLCGSGWVRSAWDMERSQLLWPAGAVRGARTVSQSSSSAPMVVPAPGL